MASHRIVFKRYLKAMKRRCLATLLLFSLPLLVQSFCVSPSTVPLQQSTSTTLRAAPSLEAIEFKNLLINNVLELRKLQERDGSISIDFGVRGGELNATSRAPQKVDYYAVSTDVGQAADHVLDSCEKLAKLNPTPNATAFLGDKEKGDQCPLNGPWKLIFTTAADASFSKNSTRGDARAQNIVDAANGRITNVIDFLPSQNGQEPVLKQLNVVIRAKRLSEKRVELNFRYAKAVLTKFLFFRFKWSLYIPVPATFITRCIVLFYRIFKKGQAKRPPQAYFDVLYLDDDVRIHKTGEDNIFVQARPTWKDAQDLIN